MAKLEIPDWLPNSRKDFALVLGGAALALGISTIPGVTLEPSHCTDCRSSLASCQDLLAESRKDEDQCHESCTERVKLCWQKYQDLRQVCGVSDRPE